MHLLPRRRPGDGSGLADTSTAGSFTIAAQNNGLTADDIRSVTLTAVRSYREAMASFAKMGTMELWYAHMSEDDLTDALGTLASDLKVQKAKLAAKHGGKRSKRAAAKVHKKVDAGNSKGKGKAELRTLEFTRKTLAKAHTRDSLQALSKLAHLVDGKYRIVNQPPVVVPIRDWIATSGMAGSDIEAGVRQLFREYRATLPDDRRHLPERFEVVDVARWSGSAVSAPAASSSCCRAATLRIHCSSRSRKRPPRCWRITCRRAGMPTRGNEWYKVNG